MTDPLVENALRRVCELITQARDIGEFEANAGVLATVDASSARPSVRTVYVHADGLALVFFVNTRSGKGVQLAWNPHVALCFFWRHLQKQIAIEGDVETLDAEQADAYWRQRPRDSTLAARVSDQKTVTGDNALARGLREEKQQFDFIEVERPAHWIGYRLAPYRFAFWDTGWHRMRLRETIERRVDGVWEMLKKTP